MQEALASGMLSDLSPVWVVKWFSVQARPPEVGAVLFALTRDARGLRLLIGSKLLDSQSEAVPPPCIRGASFCLDTGRQKA